MGVEVKSGGEGVIVADRGCNDGCCCNGRNSGWGSGWGAVGGALVGGGFGAAAVSVWDKINDTKADIQKVESTVQEAKAGIYKDISDAARGVTSEVAGVSRQVEGLVRESENRLALQAERNHCEVMKGQQEIKCLIENTAKDQEIARLNRVVDAQRDQNIINSVVQALGNKTA